MSVNLNFKDWLNALKFNSMWRDPVTSDKNFVTSVKYLAYYKQGQLKL